MYGISSEKQTDRRIRNNGMFKPDATLMESPENNHDYEAKIGRFFCSNEFGALKTPVIGLSEVDKALFSASSSRLQQLTFPSAIRFHELKTIRKKPCVCI